MKHSKIRLNRVDTGGIKFMHLDREIYTIETPVCCYYD